MPNAIISDRLQLIGSNTLVTGATGAFGSDLVKAYLQKGQRVTALGRDPQALKQLQTLGAEGVSLDLTNSEAIKLFSKSCVTFDHVVMAHGIIGARPMRMLTAEFSLNVIQTNLISVLDLLSHLLRAKKINSPGRIILVSSISAHMGVSTAVPYAASKAGIESAMRGLARDLLHKFITVNCIAPAGIQTPLFEGNQSPVLEDSNYPLGPGRVEDVSNAALFLSLEGAKYITGESIILDGGCTWLS
jgi:NAD(P)-dependent dehydrogenase (short-subunit alcohol dehydrogenase family)